MAREKPFRLRNVYFLLLYTTISTMYSSGNFAELLFFCMHLNHTFQQKSRREEEGDKKIYI